MHNSIYSLLVLFIFFSSCKGQEKPAVSSGNQLIKELFPLLHTQSLKLDSAAQISEYVVKIFEDTKGNLWFGTVSDGAACYNGKVLTYFSTKEGLCDNTVVNIVEDKEGNIWFGTHAGVSKYDGKTFTNFWEAEGLHGKGGKVFIDSKENIWAGTNHGVFRYNGTSFSEFPLPKPTMESPSYKWEKGKIWCIMEDSKGNIWFGRDGLGACKFDPSAQSTAFTHFTPKEGLCSNTVSNIVEDKEGNIWFACLSSDYPKELKEGGLCCYKPSAIADKANDKDFTVFSQYKGLSQNDIYSLYQDKAGNIWVGATGLGVYKYNKEGMILYKGTDRMDLTWSMGIQNILEDTKGNLWFGFSGGLFRFNGTAIVNVPKGNL